MAETKAKKENEVINFEDAKSTRRPFHYWKVGETEYKMKLKTASIEKIENYYGQSITELIAVDGIPKLSVLLDIAHGAIVPWHHGVSRADMADIYDEWVEDGGSLMEFFVKVVMPTLMVSGFFTESQAKEFMEATEEMLK